MFDAAKGAAYLMIATAIVCVLFIAVHYIGTILIIIAVAIIASAATKHYLQVKREREIRRLFDKQDRR